MFTGIIEEVGSILYIRKYGNNAEVAVKCSRVLDGTNIGDSISVDGVCLTVVGKNNDSFLADISYETLNKSTIGLYNSGSQVNLERAITLNTRLGGHLVLGHVDTVGYIKNITQKGNSVELTFGGFDNIRQYLALKGSIAVNGISLTISYIDDVSFSVAIIPHTFQATSLKNKRPGDKVNLEADVIARYVESLLQNSNKNNSIKTNFLRSFDGQ